MATTLTAASEFDLPGLDTLPRRAPFAASQVPTVDLLGVEPNLVDLDQVAVGPAAASSASVAVQDPPAPLATEASAPPAGGDCPVAPAPGLSGGTAAPAVPEVPMPPPADPADRPSDEDSDEEDLPPWHWGPGLDLNAMDDDDVTVLSGPAASGDAGAGPGDPPAAESSVPPAAPPGQPEAATPTVSPACFAWWWWHWWRCGTGRCCGLCWARSGSIGLQPAVPGLMYARVRQTGTADRPFVMSGDIEQDLPVPPQVWPLRRPLRSLPADLLRHGHRLSGFCCTPCWGGCDHSCSRPVSETARKPHKNHYCDRCR